MTIKTKEDVLLAVFTHIEEYLNFSPNRNLASLANRTSIPYSTLRNIHHKSVSYVEGATAYPLLSYFRSKNEALEIMEIVYSEWYKVFGRKFINYKSFNNCPEYKWTSLSTLLVDLAAREGGIEEEKIIQKYGTDIGIVEAELLCSHGYINKSGTKYIADSGYYTDPNTDSVLNRIRSDVDSFEYARMGSGAWYQRITGFTTPEVARDIKSMESQFFRDVLDRIDEDEKNTLRKNVYVKISAVGDFKDFDKE